ncbi:MAG TPA: CDP-glucose 4,6-dehydratase [Chitinophagaceae bacterium]|nr:CDP-glucose 4,6-dehydratase [Chitinophagaceae bacterium]
MKYKQIHDTYNGKRVLLTGHTGFKGSWMLVWLNKCGANVKGYALQPTDEKSHYRLINGDALCDSVIADIRDKERLKQEIISFRPDFIFHLAAQPLVRESYSHPLYTFDVNIMGTANLLDAVRELGNPCSVVIVTTDKVYENIEQHYAYREEDKLGGYDPYSASKAAAEIIISSYRNSFFNPETFAEHKKGIASARAGNVIGGGDRAKDRIIPDIIRGIEKNETIVVRNPLSVRPWQHVLEPVAGYLLLGKELAKCPGSFCSAWNLGPHVNDVLTVKEVADKAIAVFGKGSYATPAQANQPHEARLLQLDIAKALQELKWEPKLSSAEAIEWTMRWYKRLAEGKVIDLTLEQINQYEQL